MPTWIVLDTETATCRAPHHLLELGAVRLSDETEVARFESLVLPRVRIDPCASEVHGIRARDLGPALAPGEALGRFADWCAGAEAFVAHNAPFDAAVLGFECARSGIVLPPLPFLDTLRLARRAFPHAPSHRLQDLCDLLGIERERRHRALDDARACAALLAACRRELGSERLVKLGRVRCRAEIPALQGRSRERFAMLAQACARREPLEAELDDGAELRVVELLPILLFERRGSAFLEARCRATGLLRTIPAERIVRIGGGRS